MYKCDDILLLVDYDLSLGGLIVTMTHKHKIGADAVLFKGSPGSALIWVNNYIEDLEEFSTFKEN